LDNFRCLFIEPGRICKHPQENMGVEEVVHYS
jgi:hypothetical protein